MNWASPLTAWAPGHSWTRKTSHEIPKQREFCFLFNKNISGTHLKTPQEVLRSACRNFGEPIQMRVSFCSGHKSQIEP